MGIQLMKISFTAATDYLKEDTLYFRVLVKDCNQSLGLSDNNNSCTTLNTKSCNHKSALQLCSIPVQNTEAWMGGLGGAAIIIEHAQGQLVSLLQ